MATTVKTRRLTCACCGDYAGRWQQYHNQDTGFGLCARCVAWIKERNRFDDGGGDFEATYGKPGVNYAAPTQRESNS